MNTASLTLQFEKIDPQVLKQIILILLQTVAFKDKEQEFRNPTSNLKLEERIMEIILFAENRNDNLSLEVRNIKNSLDQKLRSKFITNNDNYHMEDLTESRPNFYSFFADYTTDQLRTLLENNGWTIRTLNWRDFECTNGWSQLNLSKDEDRILLNGVILNHEPHFQILLNIFDRMDLKYTAELYDGNQNLLLETTTI